MELSIIIVSWNVRDKLKNNLAAIFSSRIGFSLEVFVVDNNSADGSAAMVARNFPQVKLIANRDNLGFARANNQAIEKSCGRFILLLNPDMKVEIDTLERMVNWMKTNSQAAIAGCRLVDETGNTIKQARRFPTLLDQLAIILKLPHLFAGILNKYLRANFDYNRAKQTDSIRGGFFMINRDKIKLLGLEFKLDERYFVWFEEVDFCRQVKNGGGEVWYTPAARCIDYIGQSFKQLPRGRAQAYFRDSMLKYFKKWHPWWQYWFLKIIWPIGIFMTWAGDKFNIKIKAQT